MKVLVLLSLVALCFATQLSSGKHVTVGQDGTVTIIGTQGREILIYKNLFNPRKVDIVLRSPMGFTRKVEVDETNNMMDVNVNTLDKLRLFQHSTYFNTPMEQITQADVLAHLFRQHEGIVEEPTFQTILEHIQTLVKSGHLHESVYDVLMNLEHLYMIEELKSGHQIMGNGEVMEEVLPKMMTKDVVYPLESELVHGVRDVMPDEEIVPEYLTPMTFQEYLKYKTHGAQGLWNVEHLTPVQMLLKHIKQQHQMEQSLEEETMTGNVLNQDNMKQGYNKYSQQVPQMQVMGFQKLIQKLKFNNVAPQQWTQGQVVPQQWMQNEVVPQQWTQGQVVPQHWTQGQVVPQQWMQSGVIPQKWTQGQVVPQQWMHSGVVPQQWMHSGVVPQQWMHSEVVPQQWMHNGVVPQQWTQGQVVPEQWMQNEVVPQQWTQGKVVPQQVLNHLVGLERMMEQGQILPQEFNMLKQHYQRMMMMKMMM